MDYRPAIRDAATKLSLLDAQGELQKLDSLALVDLIIQLEEKTNLLIHPSKLVMENFRSIETVNTLLNGCEKLE